MAGSCVTLGGNYTVKKNADYLKELSEITSSKSIAHQPQQNAETANHSDEAANHGKKFYPISPAVLDSCSTEGSNSSEADKKMKVSDSFTIQAAANSAIYSSTDWLQL